MSILTSCGYRYSGGDVHLKKDFVYGLTSLLAAVVSQALVLACYLPPVDNWHHAALCASVDEVTPVFRLVLELRVPTSDNSAMKGCC